MGAPLNPPSVTLCYEGHGTDEARAREHDGPLRDVLNAAVCLAGIVDSRAARSMAMMALERALSKLRKLDLEATPVVWPEAKDVR